MSGRVKIGGELFRLGVSIISGINGSEIEATCNQAVVMEDSTDKKLDFSLRKFYIGEGMEGAMQEFKLYKLPLGLESLTASTSCKN